MAHLYGSGYTDKNQPNNQSISQPSQKNVSIELVLKDGLIIWSTGGCRG